MIAYWLLFFALAFGAILYQPARQVGVVGQTPATDARSSRSDPALLAVAIAILLMIGLRYRVGADWDVYQHFYRWTGLVPFDVALSRRTQELGYTVLNWMVARTGLGVWAANLLCALPFVVGLVSLARQQPNPWLAMAIAAPLMIIVVAMGFTRQSIALGFMLIGLTGLFRGRHYLWFFTWTLCGCLFHQSVILLIPLISFFLLRARFLSIVALVIVVSAAYYYVLPVLLKNYSLAYILQNYDAKGAIFRVSINLVAGITFFLTKSRLDLSPVESRIWTGFATLSIISMVALPLVQSSVIVDRLALYLIPLQVVAFSRLPRAMVAQGWSYVWATAIIATYAIILLFWLSYADNSKFWIPYRIYPLA